MELDQAFKLLKRDLVQSVMLKNPDYTQVFQLQTDASEDARTRKALLNSGEGMFSNTPQSQGIRHLKGGRNVADPSCDELTDHLNHESIIISQSDQSFDESISQSDRSFDESISQSDRSFDESIKSELVTTRENQTKLTGVNWMDKISKTFKSLLLLFIIIVLLNIKRT